MLIEEKLVKSGILNLSYLDLIIPFFQIPAKQFFSKISYFLNLSHHQKKLTKKPIFKRFFKGKKNCKID